MVSAFPLLGESPGIAAVREQLRRISEVRSASRRLPPVLLCGETGTGKGLVARAIHNASGRGQGPFLDLDCAAIPETLLEAELFGFERGAFTDARQAKPGLFRAADGGTLFLDEIGLLPKVLQGKLLKAVEEKSVRRLGSTKSEPVDAAIIAATNEDLAAAIREGHFREDLYHRLAAVTVVLPPLRARGEDVLLLAAHFLARACAEYGVASKILGPDAREALLLYRWPGNVRELANVMERVALLLSEPIVRAVNLGLPDGPAERAERLPPGPTPLPLRESMSGFERARLLDALRDAGGNVTLAAQRLGLPRNTLRYRIARLGLLRPPSSSGEQSPGKGKQDKSVGDIAASQCTTSSGLAWECRHLTLLRADFAVDSGAEYSRGTSRILETCLEKIESFGGRLEAHPAGGIVASFGVDPVEDAPHRAVLAAMAIRKSVGRSEAGERARVVAAIHVCTVRIGRADSSAHLHIDDLRASETVLEELVSRAQPNTILASAATVRFLRQRVAFETCGFELAQGPVHRVSTAEPRIAEFQGRPLSRFVGRERELAFLAQTVEQVVAGRGQVISLIGEPGVGKSRLVYEFRRGLTGRQVTYLEGRCLSYGGAIPYLPVLDQVRQSCGISDADSAEEITEKARCGLRQVGMDQDEWGAYLLQLLGVREGMERLAVLGPETIKARTFEVLRLLSLNGSRRRPLVLAVEDLHWIDKTSEEYFALLVESLADTPILLLTTHRPGYRPPWIEKSYASQLALRPLSFHDSLSVVHSVFQQAPLPDTVARMILGKAEGNPFFLEELTRSLIEQGDLGRSLAIPDTVQGVLMARIDRLPEETKRVLQTASVLGREFSVRLLTAIWGGTGNLELLLQELKRLEFLYERTGRTDPVHIFKHALTQEVAYESLLTSRREALHEAAGQALEALYPDRLEEYYELLAHHYSHSRNPDKAVEYLGRASEKAGKANAMAEAKAYFDQAMTLLDTMPETAVNRQRRMSLIVNAWVVFWLLFKFSEYYDISIRHEAMAVGLGNPRLLGTFYARLGWCEWGFGLFDQAIQTLTKATELCEAAGNDEDAGQADMMRQWGYLYKGDYDQVFALEKQVRHALDRRFNLRWYMLSLTASSIAYSLVGQWENAVAEAQEALRRGEEFSDDSVVSFAAWVISLAYSFKGDSVRAVTYGELGVQKAPTPANKAWAQGALGYAWCRAGEPHRGVEALAQVVSLGRVTRWRPNDFFMIFLGEGYWLSGDLDKARQTLEELLGIGESCGMRFHTASAHRLLGEIALSDTISRPDPARAALHFERSIAILREINAENELAHAYAGYGLLHKHQGSFARARDYLTKALEVFSRLGTLLEPDKVRAELAELPPL